MTNRRLCCWNIYDTWSNGIAALNDIHSLTNSRSLTLWVTIHFICLPQYKMLNDRQPATKKKALKVKLGKLSVQIVNKQTLTNIQGWKFCWFYKFKSFELIYSWQKKPRFNWGWRHHIQSPSNLSNCNTKILCNI